MKLNTRIIILITTALVLTAASSGLVAVLKTQDSGKESISKIERLGQENLERIKVDGESQVAAFREELMGLKREYLKSQVQTAVSILQAVEKDPNLNTEERQKRAHMILQSLRYGPNSEDYFWVNDLQPRMVMHPYRPEMDGQNLSENKDPNGKRLFVEFANVCKASDEGFVDYMWPKYGADKPQPKLSFVKLFKPWGWVVGTGLYIDDIDALVHARQNGLAQRLKTETEQLNQNIEMTKADIQKSIRAVLFWIGGISLAMLAAVLVACIVFTRRSVTLPIARIVAGLNDGANHVASASSQISSTSQQMAEGASEQAASIEETSASLEQMSSMTKQNAENARQANALMSEAKEVVGAANRSMGQLTESMVEITKASEETFKIIKTIDEIAFQTNLLALNAAVEAARAGEAGAGFAVVADEVRNLAMRAADAAKNTANLIEGTVKKVKDGSELAGRTNEAFRQVTGSSAKAAELIAEISAASNEQAQGIGQINTAVTELDKVTQQNAANAEESASTAEEMSAQAEAMKGMVDALVAMVGSSGKATPSHVHSGDTPRKVISSAIGKLKSKAASNKPVTKPMAEAVIPLEGEKSFADF